MELCEATILRAELVSPLADAVGLVDRDETDAPLTESGTKRLAAVADQAFRRHIQQSAASRVEVVVDLPALVRAQRAVQGRRRHPARDEAVHLVLHERQEGRDDETQTAVRTYERWHLEAERLATARGQHHHTVASLQVGVDGGALQRSELAVPPIAVQRIVQLGVVFGRRQLRLGHGRAT